MRRLLPGYAAMGQDGMSEHSTHVAMGLRGPENTLPMMTGEGPFGPIEMGGMFSILKVRRDQKPGDYRDPGWFAHPKGTVAHEWTGAPLAEPVRAATPSGEAAVKARKPSGHGHH